MIFADKLMELRKKSGWTQEELGEKLDVSRQSVSKWEGAQAFPDMNKIVKMSELFGVSTDYLLKDDIEEEKDIGSDTEKESVRQISMEEAGRFIKLKIGAAKKTALGVFLCIMSPVPLITLNAMWDTKMMSISEDAVSGAGVILMLMLIAIAVVLFIQSAAATSEFKFMDNEIFETEYGVRSVVKEKRKEYRDIRNKNIMVGVVMCILAIVPILCTLMINENSELLLIGGVDLMFMLIAAAVYGFVNTGVIWGSFDALLEEGDYTREKKKNSTFVTAYWSVVTALFLTYSFLSMKWQTSWIIFVIAAVIFPAVQEVLKRHREKKQTDK